MIIMVFERLPPRSDGPGQRRRGSLAVVESAALWESERNDGKGGEVHSLPDGIRGEG